MNCTRIILLRDTVLKYARDLIVKIGLDRTLTAGENDFEKMSYFEFGFMPRHNSDFSPGVLIINFPI